VINELESLTALGFSHTQYRAELSVSNHSEVQEWTQPLT
jgi:hypothetical protein